MSPQNPIQSNQLMPILPWLEDEWDVNSRFVSIQTTLWPQMFQPPWTRTHGGHISLTATRHHYAILALLFTMAGHRLNNTQLHYQWIHDSIVALQLLSIFLLETMSLSKSLNKIWSIKLPNYRNLYSHNHILCPLMCANIFWSTPSYQLCCNIMYWLNKSVIFVKVYKNFRDALANLTMVGIVYSSVT